MKTAMVALIGLLLPISFQSCATSDESIERAISALTNSDVEWQGTIAGLQPLFIDPAAATAVRSRSPDVDRMLLRMLDDGQRFVAAHVILSLRHNNERIGSAVVWDGLEVNLLASGKVQIAASQRLKIKQLWVSRLHKPSR